jgi:hypothetical protein
MIFFIPELKPPPRYPKLENRTLSALFDRLYRAMFIVPTFSNLWLSVNRNHVPLARVSQLYAFGIICISN